MGILLFLKSMQSNEDLIKKLVKFVYDSVQVKCGVRIEDAVCLISTIVAERWIAVVGEFNIIEHELEPGSAVFSEKMNQLLDGPNYTDDWKELPKDRVFGKIKNKRERRIDISALPSIKKVFEYHA